jgi:hypothetical protein
MKTWTVVRNIQQGSLEILAAQSHCRGSVAAECFWTLSFPFPDPRWEGMT